MADGVTSTDVLAALPADLSDYRCIVLSINTSFSAGDISAFSDYLDEGGRILALGENSGFAAANAAMTSLASSLGADVSIVPDGIDGGFNATTDIDSSPFTEGVSSLLYAATSQVAVSGEATSLVRTLTGSVTFIAAAPVGNGFFFLSGDGNWAWDNAGYTTNDNGVLVSNICSAAQVEPTPTPTPTSTPRPLPTARPQLGGAAAGIISAITTGVQNSQQVFGADPTAVGIAPPSTGTGVNITPPSTGDAGLEGSSSTSVLLVGGLVLGGLVVLTAARRLARRGL
jgi:hypothetical protein